MVDTYSRICPSQRAKRGLTVPVAPQVGRCIPAALSKTRAEYFEVTVVASFLVKKCRHCFFPVSSKVADRWLRGCVFFLDTLCLP